MSFVLRCDDFVSTKWIEEEDLEEEDDFIVKEILRKMYTKHLFRQVEYTV